MDSTCDWIQHSHGEDMFMELDKNIYLIDQKYHTSDMKHPLIISRITNIN